MLAAALAAGLLSVAGGTTAQAAVSTTSPGVGPIDPNTGYPFWYQDATGERYELCFDRGALDSLCLARPENPNGRPYVGDSEKETNLAADPETFWFDAAASVDTPGGVSATYVAAKEATFGGPDEGVRPGEQIAFGRVRIRVDNLVAGDRYVVTHPYGQQEFAAADADGDATTPGDGEINFTEDLGCFDLPCDFDMANDSSVTSYLRWAPAATGAPAGYVGNPEVPHEVVGSPFGTNFFRIERVGPGGARVNVAETDLFNVQGKLWNPTDPMLGIVSDRNLVDFGRLDYTTPGAQLGVRTLTLTNAGGGTDALDLQQLQIAGEDASAFTLVADACSTTSLAAGATCDVQVAYNPQAGGATEAQLEVRSDGADASPYQRILLRGVAKDPANPDPKDLRATGPLSLEHGFPLWYQDESGLQLALCDDPTDPYCTAMTGTYPNGMSFPGSFEDELFWWSAEATMETSNGQDASLILAQEAAFLNEVAAHGDQIAFGRIRIRAGGLTAGQTYTVTTPYGVYEFVAEDDEDRGINYTEDLGCLQTPCDFSKVNQSNVGPFLQRTEGAPEGYIGDPNADGAADGSVTRAPHGAVFRIEGPGVYAPEGDDTEAPPPADACPTVGGATTDCVEIGDFSISGKKWQAPAGGLLALDGVSAADGTLVRSSTVDLGSAGRGTAGAVRTLTLKNVGQVPAPVGDLTLQNGGVVRIVSDTCSDATLEAGATCTFGVQLNPSADSTASGPLADHVLIRDIATDEAGPQAGQIYLRGRVAAPGAGLAAPSRPALQMADDTGLSRSDNVTNAQTLTVRGAAATGQTVTVLVDGVPTGTVPAVVAGAWSLDLPGLVEGPHEVTAVYADGTTSAPMTVAVDRTAPQGQPTLTLVAGSDTGTPGDNATADRTPRVSGTAPADTALVRLQLAGNPVGEAVVGADGTWRYTLPQLPANGSHRLRAVPVDAAGNVGVATVLDVQTDSRLPNVSVPRMEPVSDTVLARRVSTLVSWTGRDGGTGVGSFQLQVSRDGGAFTNVALPDPTATSVQQKVAVGHRYRFRVRATDEAGNVTAWSDAGAVRARVVQEDGRAVDYTRQRRWTDRKPRRASGGSLTFASARGATAAVTTRAESVTLVTSTGPNRGRAAIVVNGRRVRTVDLYAPRTRNRRLAITVDGLDPRVRSEVAVRVLHRKRRASNGTRVYVDGFLVMR